MTFKKYFLFFFWIISSFSLKAFIEKPLYIVVTSYNNARWVEKNLDSIFCQEYSNYYVVIVDDCSTDNTVALVENYIQEHNWNKIMFIKNNVRQWKLKNLFSVYHMAPDWAIIIQIDGDDWLPHSKVFQEINNAYSENDIWITYGSFIRVKSKDVEINDEKPQFAHGKLPLRPTPRHILVSNRLRECGWLYMPIRTFYAWLFKLVKLQDLTTKNVAGFQGQLFPFADDQAMMYPMLEMASKNHIHFFPDIMYIATESEKRGKEKLIDYTPIVQSCDQEIATSLKYTPLEKPIIHHLKSYLNHKATLLLFVDDFLTLSEYLYSVGIFVKGYENICILYQTNSSLLSKVLSDTPLENIAQSFNLSSMEERISFKKYFNELKTKHIILADSAYPFENFVDVGYCIYLLEKTFAYGFYLNLDLTKKPDHIYTTNIDDSISFWKFFFSKDGEWGSFNTINNVLYKKQTIEHLIEKIEESGFEAISSWQQEAVDLEKIGLFYQNKRIRS